MADPQPLTNEPSARTETGELKDQATTQQTSQADSTTTQSTDSTGQTTTDKSSSTEKKPEPTTGAPEAYAEFKVPEGIELKGEQLTQATAIFKELGLSQDAAQRLVDFHANQMKAIAAAPDNSFDEMTNGWKTKAEADPDIGSFDGAKALGLKTTIAKGLDALGDPASVKEFKDALNLTGLGNHPAVIKTLAKFAERVVEGKGIDMNGTKPVEPKAPGQAKPSVASAMYPNLPA